MRSAEELLTAVIADLAGLRLSYQKGGLLSEFKGELLPLGLIGGRDDIARFRRVFLILDALIRNRISRTILESGSFTHIAVFGGTMVGKSTIVNVLAEKSIADTSPEAGYTKQARAFTVGSGKLFGSNKFIFNNFKFYEETKPPQVEFNSYSRQSLETYGLPNEIALWDTPDCDSVYSANYLESLVEAVTIADLAIYVTSVDKYADEIVLEWLFCLASAGIQFLGCLNKTSSKNRQTVIERQIGTVFPSMARLTGTPAPRIKVVPLKNLVESDDESDLWGNSHPEARELRASVIKEVATADRNVAARAAFEYISLHLETVLEPARAEIYSRQKWERTVENSLKMFKQSYEDKYLNSPSTIEPIRRLSVEILNLLDPNIVGLKETLQAMRWLTRWPAKMILGIGRHAFKMVFQNGLDARDVKVAPELEAYTEAHIGLLKALGGCITEECKAPRHHPFWDSLNKEWQEQADRLTTIFAEQIEDHMQKTDADIKAAARDILEQLKQMPTVLNLLRAGRVSANVSGVLIGIMLPHAGRIIYDLVEEILVVPLMLSATEAAARASVDTYVKQRQAQVIEKLREEASILSSTIYRQPFRDLADKAMARSGALGIGQELVDRLQSNLDALHDACQPGYSK